MFFVDVVLEFDSFIEILFIVYVIYCFGDISVKCFLWERDLFFGFDLKKCVDFGFLCFFFNLVIVKFVLYGVCMFLDVLNWELLL